MHIPAGEEHWHGAAPESYLLHLAVSVGATDWLDAVSDEDYASATERRAAARQPATIHSRCSP